MRKKKSNREKKSAKARSRARKKRSLTRKKRLAKARRKSRRIPVFVTAKTNRRVMFNPNRRDWRTEKLKKSEKD